MPSFFSKDNDYSITDGSTLKWRELYKAMGPFQVSKTVMPEREDFTQMEQFRDVMQGNYKYQIAVESEDEFHTIDDIRGWHVWIRNGWKFVIRDGDEDVPTCQRTIQYDSVEDIGKAYQSSTKQVAVRLSWTYGI